MLKIRTYEEGDFPRYALFLRAIKETASADYSPRQIAAWAQVDEARWRQKLAASRVLVAIKATLPVGFITAWMTISIYCLSLQTIAARASPARCSIHY
jgi:putative acetyltransferase